MKSLLEAECPGVISCADILALVARDSIVVTVSALIHKLINPTSLHYNSFNYCMIQGGPNWEVPTGRRDGLISNVSEALANIPAPTFNFSRLQTSFASKGLDLKDLVLLSGNRSRTSEMYILMID